MCCRRDPSSDSTNICLPSAAILDTGTAFLLQTTHTSQFLSLLFSCVDCLNSDPLLFVILFTSHISFYPCCLFIQAIWRHCFLHSEGDISGTTSSADTILRATSVYFYFTHNWCLRASYSLNKQSNTVECLYVTVIFLYIMLSAGALI